MSVGPVGLQVHLTRKDMIDDYNLIEATELDQANS